MGSANKIITNDACSATLRRDFETQFVSLTAAVQR